MRLSRLRTWLPAALRVVVWAFGWLAVWQLFLFDLLAIEAGPQATAFADEGGDRRTLWVGVGTTLVLGTIGFLLLASSSGFKSYSVGWSRVWLVSGGFLVVVGLSASVLYPSTRGLVIDPAQRFVALERHWLYAETVDVVPFSEIALRTLHPEGYYLSAVSGRYAIDLLRPDRRVLRIAKDVEPVPVTS